MDEDASCVRRKEIAVGKLLPNMGRAALAAATILFFARQVQPPQSRPGSACEALVMIDWIAEITSIRPPEAAFATPGRANELADWGCGKIGFPFWPADGGKLETRRTALVKPTEMQAILKVLTELKEKDLSISRAGPYLISVRSGNETRYLDLGPKKSALEILNRIGFHATPAVREALRPLLLALHVRQSR